MKLDLHGIRHIEVSNKVDSFLWEAIQRNAPSVEIVTGNSKRMKQIVYDCVYDYGFVCTDCFMNLGAFIVTLI
jgi:DNA-nicking Smr family endonuclease